MSARLPCSPAPAPAAAPVAAPAAIAPAAALVAAGDPDARMTPAVRRLLREHGLSPEQIQGTGGGGRITRDDVLAVVETIRTGGAAPVAVMAPAATAQHRACRTDHLRAGSEGPGAAAPSRSPRARTKSCSR